MVTIDGMEFGSGYILFAASYSEEAEQEAKAYCRHYNLTPQMVSIKKTKNADTKKYELVLVEVI